MKNNLTLYINLFIVILPLISGCSTTAKVWKPYDNVTIESSEEINPDSNNRASPIQVKIYELSSRSTFDNLDFDRAFYNAKTLLSDQMLSSAEYTIQPSETIKHKIKLQKNSRFVAILAGFIDIDNSRWKHIYKVKPHGHYNHHISISGKSIIAGKVEEDEKEEDASPTNIDQDEGKKSLTLDDVKEGAEKGGEAIEKASSTKQSINGLLK